MGHALADKCFNLDPKVFIHTQQKISLWTQQQEGLTEGLTRGIIPESKWKQTVIFSAGYIGNVAFWTSIIIIAAAVEKYLSWKIAMGLQIIATTNLFTDGIWYPLSSIYQKDDGDFGRIAKECGNTHLVLATAVVVAQTALAMFAFIKL